MAGFDEDRIVRLLEARFAKTGSSLVRGIGDDAAVVRSRGAREHWVVTTDMLIEEIDFRRAWFSPAQVGHKSLAANLSDLAAMGARPRFFTVSLALPEGILPRWITACYRGMAALARRHGVLLIGGDLSRSPSGIQITITAIGETVGRRPLYRSGGRPGDILYVTGKLGMAASGLELLRQGRAAGNTRAERAALRSQRTPLPRCETGLWLARSRLVRCMMDLSDGLSIDLPRLCRASGTGAELSGSLLPVFPDSRRWHCDPLALALHGGEDFELLLAVPARQTERLEKSYPSSLPRITRIGRLCSRPGVRWSPDATAPLRPLKPAGFDHFRK